MQPFFVVNPNLSSLDIQDALLEKFSTVKALQSLLLFGCFDQVQLRVSEEVLHDGLWVMVDLLKEVEMLHEYLAEKV